MRIKIAFAFVILAFGCSLYYGITSFAGCPPNWTGYPTFKVCPDRPEEKTNWKILWWDGTIE